MMARIRSHLPLALTLLASASFFSPRAHAQTRESAPVSQLRTPPLGGAVSEVVLGSTFILLAPFIAARTGDALQATNLPTCNNPETFAQCQEDSGPRWDEVHAQDQHAARVAGGVFAAITGVGLGLLTHGAYRIKHIRNERRALLSPRTWHLNATSRSASVTLGWMF